MSCSRVFHPDVAVIDFNLPKLFSLGNRSENEERGRSYPVFWFWPPKVTAKWPLRPAKWRQWFRPEIGQRRSSVRGLAPSRFGQYLRLLRLAVRALFPTPKRSAPEGPLESLSSREYQVFQLIIDPTSGRGNRIAVEPVKSKDHRYLPRQPDAKTGYPRRARARQVRHSKRLNVGSLSWPLLLPW